MKKQPKSQREFALFVLPRVYLCALIASLYHNQRGGGMRSSVSSFEPRFFGGGGGERVCGWPFGVHRARRNRRRLQGLGAYSSFVNEGECFCRLFEFGTLANF